MTEPIQINKKQKGNNIFRKYGLMESKFDPEKPSPPNSFIFNCELRLETYFNSIDFNKKIK